MRQRRGCDGRRRGALRSAQDVFASDGPVVTPGTSRLPPSLTATKSVASRLTLPPLSRISRAEASSRRGGRTPFQRASDEGVHARVDLGAQPEVQAFRQAAAALLQPFAKRHPHISHRRSLVRCAVAQRQPPEDRRWPPAIGAGRALRDAVASASRLLHRASGHDLADWIDHLPRHSQLGRSGASASPVRS